MPFEIARNAKSLGKPKIPADSLAISSRKGPKGGVYLAFQFGDALAEELGFVEDMKLEVAWGTQEDRGKLRLRAAEDGAFRLRRNQQSQQLLQFTVSDLPADFSGKTYKRQKVSNVQNLRPTDTKASAHVIVTLPHNFYGRPGALGDE